MRSVYPTILVGHASYKYHGFRVKNTFFFHFSRSFFNRAQCLFPIVSSGPQDSMRFVRPVAYQNSGKYTLRMIVIVTNTFSLLSAVIAKWKVVY